MKIVLRPKSLTTILTMDFSHQLYAVGYYCHPSFSYEETEAQRLGNLRSHSFGGRKKWEHMESEVFTTTVFLPLFFPEMKTLVLNTNSWDHSNLKITRKLTVFSYKTYYKPIVIKTVWY